MARYVFVLDNSFLNSSSFFFFKFQKNLANSLKNLTLKKRKVEEDPENDNPPKRLKTDGGKKPQRPEARVPKVSNDRKTCKAS
jgi:hypothetical protein